MDERSAMRMSDQHQPTKSGLVIIRSELGKDSRFTQISCKIAFSFLSALSRKRVAQEETSNRHQCKSDSLSTERKNQREPRLSFLPPTAKVGKPFLPTIAVTRSKGGTDLPM